MQARLKLRGQLRFSSLQYLIIEPITRKTSSNAAEETPTETLTVKLKNYVLLSPEAIKLDDANRQALPKMTNKEPLALIEYWAVDPDYDGKVFRSVWQGYRGNTSNDADVLRVVTTVTVTVTTLAKPGCAGCACARSMCLALWPKWVRPFDLPCQPQTTV